MQNIKSHLISQVLLRRFTYNGLLKVHFKKDRKVDYKATDQIGFIPLPKEFIQFSEDKWSKTEKAFGMILQSLQNGTLLEDPEKVEVVKKFMILHYVRSPAFWRMLENKEKKTFLEVFEKIKKDHPERESEINSQFLHHRKEWLINIVKISPNTINDVIKKIKADLYKFHLEIGVINGSSELILGDLPVVTKTKEGAVGLLAGAAFHNSDGFMMPLSSKDIAAFNVKDTGLNYRVLTNKQVKRINKLSKAQSITEYYSLPLENEVKKFIRKNITR